MRFPNKVILFSFQTHLYMEGSEISNNRETKCKLEQG